MRLVRSLYQDVVWGVPEWLVSSVAGHWLMPRVLRRPIYRAMRLDVRTYGVYSGVTITGGWRLADDVVIAARATQVGATQAVR